MTDMDPLGLLGAALGLGFLSGIRLYATVLTLGLALKFELLDLSPTFAGLQVLNDWRIISVAGVAVLVEFIADKVPWLDSLWDAVHTMVRPVGGALLAMAAAESVNPAFQVILGLLAGGAALSSHATKAAARLTINHSPEPFSNIATSAFEDVLVPVGVFYTLKYPGIVLSILLVFLVAFFFLAPRMFRALRVEIAAIGAVLSRAIAGEEARRVEPPDLPAGLSSAEKTKRLRQYLLQFSNGLPPGHLDHLARELGIREEPPALRAVPAKGMRGLHRSIGYLCLIGDLVFVTRRSWRYQHRRVPLSDLGEVSFKPGRFLDHLILLRGKSSIRFDLFKNSAREASGFAAALNALRV
jgi:hypothetical protein